MYDLLIGNARICDGTGAVLYEDGEYQGGLPGQVLRSYGAQENMSRKVNVLQRN